MEKDQEKSRESKQSKNLQIRKQTTQSGKSKNPVPKKSSGKRSVRGGRPVGRTHLKGDSGDVLRDVFVPDKTDGVG